jgi:hypothetical protein
MVFKSTGDWARARVLATGFSRMMAFKFTVDVGVVTKNSPPEDLHTITFD